MNGNQGIEGDLQYVRDIVEKSERPKAPTSIYYLWAIICLIGFPMVDFAPHSVGLFWTIAAPLGFALSGILGWRFSAKLGQVSRNQGLTYAFHWLGVLVALFLVSLLVVADVVGHAAMGQIILLVLALGYFTAGLYQDRHLVWIGILLALSYVFVLFVEGWVWTIAGVAVAASLVASALIGGRRERA